MKKQKLAVNFVGFSLIIGLAMLTNLVAFAGPSSKKTVVIPMVLTTDEKELGSAECIPFAKNIEKRTNGRYKIELHFLQTLFKDTDLPKAVPSGACILAKANFGMWSGVVPSASAYELSGGLWTREQLWRAIDGEYGKALSQDFERLAKTKILTITPMGGADMIITRNKTIRKPDDMVGLKLRAPTAAMLRFIEDCGAAPVMMSSVEVYTALERGTLDGMVSALSSPQMPGWLAVAPYLTVAQWTADAGFGIIMNLDFWNQLPKDVQTIFLEEADAAKFRIRKGLGGRSERALAIAKTDRYLKECAILTDDEIAAFRKRTMPGQVEFLAKGVGKDRAQELIKMIEAVR